MAHWRIIPERSVGVHSCCICGRFKTFCKAQSTLGSTGVVASQRTTFLDVQLSVASTNWFAYIYKRWGYNDFQLETHSQQGTNSKGWQWKMAETLNICHETFNSLFCSRKHSWLMQQHCIFFPFTSLSRWGFFLLKLHKKKVWNGHTCKYRLVVELMQQPALGPHWQILIAFVHFADSLAVSTVLSFLLSGHDLPFGAACLL